MSLGERDGIALLLVVIMLAALATLAVPFAASMRQQETASRKFKFDAMARLQAGAAAEYARGHLVYSVDALEAADAAQGPFNTPDADAEWELHVIPLDASSPSGGTVGDAMGFTVDESGDRTAVSLAVEDESGKVDLNSASPALIGNLFAGTVTTEKVDDGDGTLDVESTLFFPERGVLWVEGELIAYSRKTDSSFQGLQRGKELSWGLSARTGQKHGEGALVVDARAYVVAKQHLLTDDAGVPLPLRTITEVRSSGLAGVGAGVLSAADLEPVLRDLTVHGGRFHDLGWYSGQALASAPSEHKDGGWVLPIKSPWHYGVGSAVRITDGEEKLHGHVIGFEFSGAANMPVPVVDVPLGGVNPDTAFAEVEERAPVNINTAPFRVLYACLHGVGIGRQGGVSGEEAYAIAEAIISQRRSSPISGLSDYRNLLAGISLDEFDNQDREALFLNAQVPNHILLRSGTAGFRFDSADRYTIDSSVKVIGPGGRERGSHRLRETVLTAWPEPVVWGVESQRQFREFANRFGWLNWMSTGPNPLAYEAPTRQRPIRPFASYDANQFGSSNRDSGYVELTPSREQEKETDQVFLQSFAGSSSDAYEVAGNGFNLNLGGLFQAAPGNAAQMLVPGRLEFWVRPNRWQGGDLGYLCDVAEDEFHNCFSIYYDPSNDWLVFRMGESSAGIVPQVEEPRLLPAWAEVRFPMEGFGLALGSWHHVAVEWSGTGYGEMALLVDGVAHLQQRGGPYADQADDPANRVGFTYATTDPDISPLTFLTADIGPQDTEIQVADARAFGVRGSIRVGGEVMLFENEGESNTLTVVRGNARGGGRGGGDGEGGRGSSIGDTWWDTSETDSRIWFGRQRGLNGTEATAHYAGEPVTPAGFSASLIAVLPPSATDIEEAEDELPPLPPEEVEEGEEAPPPQSAPTLVTQPFRQSWDAYADPHCWAESAGQAGRELYRHSGDIIENMDDAFGRRAVYTGGAFINPNDYTGGYLGKGGNLAIPNSYCLGPNAREQLGQGAGFTLPDPMEIEPEDEYDFARVWVPQMRGCDPLNDEQISFLGTDPITLLSTEAGITLGETESLFVRSRRTGSWPTEGYMVLCSVSWQGAPGGPPGLGGRGRGGFGRGGGGDGGLCVPWLDAYEGVTSAVFETIGEQFGMPEIPGMTDRGDGTLGYEYVRYHIEQGGETETETGFERIVIDERGLFGTDPMQVDSTATETPFKEVWAFPISIVADYEGGGEIWEAYPPSGMLQVEDEWIEYYFYRYDSGTGRVHFITPIWDKIVDSVVATTREAFSGMEGGFNPRGMRGVFGRLISSIVGTNRGQAGTNSLPHPAPGGASGSVTTGGIELIPAFLLHGDVANPYDTITLVDEYDANLDVGGIPYVGNVHWRTSRADDTPGTWVAFDSGVGRGFLSGGRSRALRFPSGETPERYRVPPGLGGGQNLAAGGRARMGAGPVRGRSATRYSGVGLYQVPASGRGGGGARVWIDREELDDIPDNEMGLETQTVVGMLDEIRIRSTGRWQRGEDADERLQVRTASVDGEPIAPEAEDILLDVPFGRWQALGVQTDGGLVKIGDEIIAFRGSQPEGERTLLTGCERGFLSPEASAVDFPTIGIGQPVLFLKYADMTQLDSGMSTSDAIVPILDSKDLRRNDGYVLIDREVIGYTTVGRTVLDMPLRIGEEEGLFRGRFGTTPNTHGAGAIVYEIPFRYWDRYAELADDPSMSFVQVVRSQPEASWKALSWEEDVPGAYLDIECLARFGGSPGWQTEPGNRPGELYYFDDPDSTRGDFPAASQVELRFLMRFLPGAYDSSHDWKDTPRLKAVYTEYQGRPMILDHEEVR